MVSRILVCAVAAWILVPGGSGRATPPYKIVDLGTLGGSTSTARGINASGQVVGFAETADGQQHAFVYSEGKLSDLGTLEGPDGRFSDAFDINAAGQVVGYSERAGGTPHAFLHAKGKILNRRGKMADLGGLLSPKSSSHAYAINTHGDVVGASAGRAFLYHDGKMLGLDRHIPLGAKLDLVPLDDESSPAWFTSEAKAINDQGDVAGYAATDIGPPIRGFRAFLYSKRKLVDLGTLPGGTWSIAQGINDRGQVVGYGDTAGGETHGFLYAEGTMTDLGTLGGRTSSAQDINASGQIVGNSDTADGALHAFLFDDGAMIDLNTLVDPVGGWVLTSAAAINDSGWIIGSGKAPDGQSRAFLLRPTE